MINWQVRVKNKQFWLSLIPATLLLIQVTAGVFGFEMDLGELGDKLMAVANAIFGVLTILGVVVDPTTKGINDSAQAMNYSKPKEG